MTKFKITRIGYNKTSIEYQVANDLQSLSDYLYDRYRDKVISIQIEPVIKVG